MDTFLKVTAGVLITTILSLVLHRQSPDMSLLLTIFVCCMVVIAAITYIKPVLDLLHRIVDIGEFSSEFLTILLKVTGIGLVSQIAGLICEDAGNQTLSKTLQILTTAVILCISVPLFDEILVLMELVLGEI